MSEVRACVQVGPVLLGSRSVFRYTEDQYRRWTWGPFIVTRSARWLFFTWRGRLYVRVTHG